LKGFQKLVPVDEALERFLHATEFKPKKVTLRIQSALNYILAEDIIASTDLPRTDRSAVDGYAVDAEATVEASQTEPIIFELMDSKATGKSQAKQVWTGNSLPKGANAVVMLENTKIVGNRVEVWSPAARWENVSRRGEDIQKGEIAVEAGTRFKPQHLALAAALGVSEVKVFKKPVIAVLATGNELAELGAKLQENQIFESNGPVLSALCVELGADPLDLGIAKDDVDEIAEKLKIGLEKADAIITSGGTSVGAPDLVPEAVNALGKPGIIVHGVAMRPGMPTALAIVRSKPIIVLPGNPVAAMLGFEVFGRPLVSKMLGLKQVELRPVLKAKITKRIATTLGRKNLVRVRVFEKNDDFLAEPVSARGSGLFSTMTKSNGYVIVPENLEGLEEGDIVSVHMFDNLGVIGEDVQKTVIT
jgi:molybdopterin molybdotransferase